MPFLGPKTLNATGDTVYHQIPPFRFLNQDSTWVTEKDMEGKIYVSGFLLHSSIALWTEWPSATKARTLAFAPAMASVLGLVPPLLKLIVLSRFHSVTVS